MLSVGDYAPSFVLSSTDGSEFSSDALENKTILYFYPRDETPLCTIEARGFSAAYDSLKDAGIEVVGVSADDLESHNAFREKEGIPYHLLCDTDNRIADLFEIPRYQTPPMDIFAKRTTFLLDTDKKILEVWDDFDSDVNLHTEDVVTFVMEILEKAED